MSRHVTRMTIDDVTHIDDEQKARIVDSYPPHEREARLRGMPQLGSGRVFPVGEADIACTAMAAPDHWCHIGGIDFGWDHPTAAVKLLWDRDGDIVYVAQSYRVREATPVIHAAALRPWGGDMPWSWPQDGYQHDKQSGVSIAAAYRAQGLKMLDSHAQFEDGNSGVEAGLMQMLERMQTGRLKVFEHLTDWFDEFRLYHRKDGRVVMERDDLMAATRYALMSLRYSRAVRRPARARRALTEYAIFGD